MSVERTRYIGGVGRMGWLEAADWQGVEALAPDAEAALLDAAAAHLPAGVRLLGLDACGVDYVIDGIAKRQAFTAPRSAGQLAAELPALLAELG